MQMSWIDGSHLTAYAIGQFVWGICGDKLGTRRVVLAGMLASVAAALAMGASTLACKNSYSTRRSLKKWFCNLGQAMFSWESTRGRAQKLIGAVPLSAHHIKKPSVGESLGKKGSHLRRRSTNSSAVSMLL